MLLLLLVFLLLPLIISFEYFLYPFIVSKNLFFIIPADSCAAQVSRLILNLLEANCPLDESIYSKPMESSRFNDPESNRETESDIMQDGGGGTSLGEGMCREEM